MPRRRSSGPLAWRAAAWEKQFSDQAGKITDVSARLAALPSHPNPDTDLDGAAAQEAAELRNRRTKALGLDAALFAAGPVAKSATLGTKAIKTAVTTGRAARIGVAATAYHRAFDGHMRAAYAKAGIAMTDPAALKAFAKNNTDIVRQAVRAGLTNMLIGEASGATAKGINKVLDKALGPISENMLKRGIKAVGKQALPSETERRK